MRHDLTSKHAGQLAHKLAVPVYMGTFVTTLDSGELSAWVAAASLLEAWHDEQGQQGPLSRHSCKVLYDEGTEYRDSAGRMVRQLYVTSDAPDWMLRHLAGFLYGWLTRGGYEMLPAELWGAAGRAGALRSRHKYMTDDQHR